MIFIQTGSQDNKNLSEQFFLFGFCFLNIPVPVPVPTLKTCHCRLYKTLTMTLINCLGYFRGMNTIGLIDLKIFINGETCGFLQQLKETLTNDVIMTSQQIVRFRGGGVIRSEVRDGGLTISHLLLSGRGGRVKFTNTFFNLKIKLRARLSTTHLVLDYKIDSVGVLY